MERLTQQSAPVYEALEQFKSMRVVPFDVPGHKRGRGNPELTAFLGEKCVGIDVNSMKPLDNLCHPVSVIAQAEQLAAEAFGASSAINALVLCGAVPVYINPGVDPRLGISLGMDLEDVKHAIDCNPDAKAVLVNNPTYYGICSDLRSITEYAHARGMLVLADEAHGTHFSFGPEEV